MKNLIPLAILMMLFVGTAKGDVVKTVGAAGANYATLKAAFDAINAGTVRTGVITLQIIAGTTETASAVLNSSGSGNASYTSVIIYPTLANLIIAGNFSASTIDLQGADNVIIDGRVNLGGSSPGLEISNINTGSFASAIRFILSAESNTVRYCNLKSSCYSAGVGMINFTSSTTGNGNDNNTIEYCNITNAGSRPVNAIFSSGTAGRENSGNIIRNNNIYNFFNANSNSYGINISNSSTDWTISDNSFYETTSFAPAGAFKYYPLFINTGNNNIISNNYIGGSAPLCAGTAWIINSNVTHYFCGIYVNGGTACTVQNNTIKNINHTSVADNPWDGIYINDGNVNVTGNTIGATTGISSIIITAPLPAATTTITGGVVNNNITIVGGGSGYTTVPLISFSAPPTGGTAPTATATVSGGAVTAINVTYGGSGYLLAPNVYFDGQTNNYSTSHGMIKQSSGTVTISNNNIGSITTVGSATYSHGFESMYVRGVAGVLTISNNLIGSLTTANSIHVSSTAASALQKQDVFGIYSSGIGTTIISNNTIANLHNAYTGSNSGSRARGIQTIAGSNTVQNNTVRNISSASSQISAATSASVIGISQTASIDGTTQTVTGNTIYDLSNTNTNAFRVQILGLYYAGPPSGTNAVSGNFVHSLSVSSTDIGATIYGVDMNSGVATCANNIINLGGNTLGYLINGILDGTTAGNIVNFYFNTVYIGGSVSSGVTSATSAFNNANNTSTRDYRNNILYNARTGGTTGKHYAIVLAGVSGLTINYNDYFFAGTTLGKIGSLEKATLAQWKTGTSQDANSLSINPGFTIPGGTSAFNYYASAVLPGVFGTGITTDYDGLTRGATPKMGALEVNGYVWQGGVSTDFNTAGNWTGGVVPLAGADIIFAVAPNNHCVLDQNRILGKITNAQATYHLVVNGKQLTISDSIKFTNSAKIDATATSSHVVFAGTLAQIIPSGAFVSNTVDGLTVNNSHGLTLNGDLTIPQTLTLTNGTFAIGANTLTLNGPITTTDGMLTGGSSTNIIVGGSSAATLPAVSLHNFTLNRSSGISLGGEVSIGGTLTLTSGTLTVGANTLTISGNSPARTSGNIDASNASATLVFANSGAITLPASVFAGIINNLTLSGTGGVTAGSDITVNGILNLAAANPSGSKGLLEMTISYTNYPGTLITQYLNSYILTMGETATTIGTGDVTGTVKRTTIVANTPYTFGHQYTTISLTTGTMPTALAVSITIGTTPGNTTPADDKIRDAIKRTYEILPTGGSGSRVTANFHYLDNELTSSISPYHTNTEVKLTTMDYDIDINNHGAPYSDEHGRANYDYTNKYIGLSSVPIDYFIQIPVTHEWRTIFTLRDYGVAYYTWNGSTNTDWNTAANWTLSDGGSSAPNTLSHVIIPDVSTTNNRSPVLPSSVTINTLSIENGGILNMGSSTLTIQNSFSGGWEDQNPSGNDPGTSIVYFTTANTTISGFARFNKVRIADGADITNQAGSKMIIQDSVKRIGTGTGNWYADVFDNIVEYNKSGAQSVILPDGITSYHNLILSGSGIKTLPALFITGNLSTSGTATAIAAGAMTIAGNVTIGEGSAFSTGSFNHAFDGNFDNQGTFTASPGYTIMLNGSAAQSLLGTATTNFDNLTINNTHDVTLFTNENINNVLTLTNGNIIVQETTLGIKGTISKTSGFIDASATNATISFAGIAAQTIPAETFYNNEVYNLNLSNSNNVTLNGTLRLLNTFTSVSGQLDAITNLPTVIYAGIAPQTLGSNLYFNNILHNLTIDNATGVTLSNDAITTVSGTLAINSGKIFEIAPGKQLTVSGTLTNNAGFSGLVIKSNASSGTGTGSLITNNGVSGTVERYIPNNLKWHFLSSPVTAQPVWPEFAPAPSSNSFGSGPWNWDFYYWNPNADLNSQLYWINLRKDIAGTYNSGTIDATGNDAGYGIAIPEFTVGRGYLTAYNAGWNQATGSPETHLFTGTLNSGLVEKAIIKGANSFNLAGNPYPSAIDWKASGWNRGVLVPSGGGFDYWIFNDNSGNYGVFNSNSDGVGTNGTTRYIAPMQGFFVEAVASGTLSMTSTVQVHATQNWLKENTDVDNLLRLKLTTSANGFSDEMIVVVNSDYSNGGSQKFWSMYTEAPELYAIKDGSTYSIDRMPSVDENSTVAIGIKAGVAASYTLDVTGVTNFFIAKSIILEDLKTGTTRDLKNNPSFTFSANPGDDVERFHLHFGGPFGINHQGNQFEFTIFSVNNSVYVSTDSRKSLDGIIYIYNIIGQKIIQKKIVDNISRIDLSAPAGCYIVTIVSNNQTYSKKLFIH